MATLSRPISDDLHEEYSAKLEQLLDDHDEISEKKSRITKALKGELLIIARGIAHARRVLKGIDGPQESIPGTEVGERRKDPAVEAILKAAERVRVAKAEDLDGEKAKAARRAGLEKNADAILENAGAGELVKGELRGPAERFVKKKRRS